MIKTLQTKLRLSSLKSDCQFHSYQRDGKSGLHSGKREGIYEPGVGFDWAMIIPSKMIIVRHSSDPVHDRISHFLLSFCSASLSECQLSSRSKHLHAQARSDMSPQRVHHGGGKETLLQSRQYQYVTSGTSQYKPKETEGKSSKLQQRQILVSPFITLNTKYHQSKMDSFKLFGCRH